MFRRLTQSRISLRLPALIVSALAVSIATSSAVYYQVFKSEIRQQTEQRAQLLSEGTRRAYTTWLDEMFRTIEDLGEGHLAPDAMRSFNEALALQSPGWLEEVRTAYLDANTYPAGERRRLDRGLVHRVAFHGE